MVSTPSERASEPESPLPPFGASAPSVARRLSVATAAVVTTNVDSHAAEGGREGGAPAPRADLPPLLLQWQWEGREEGRKSGGEISAKCPRQTPLWQSSAFWVLPIGLTGSFFSMLNLGSAMSRFAFGSGNSGFFDNIVAVVSPVGRIRSNSEGVVAGAEKRGKGREGESAT